MQTEELTQSLSLTDYITPSNAAAGTVNSPGLDISKFGRVLYEIQIGAITGAGTLNATLQSCSLANFASGVHNMTGGAITQITNASPNCRVTLETRPDAVAQQNVNDRYVRLQVVVATNNVVYGATGWGGEAVQKPASNDNVNTTVLPQQIVVN